MAVLTITSCFAKTLSFLKQLETDWGLEPRQKAQIQTLRLKASFLRALFSCTGKWHLDDMNLKIFLCHIQTVTLKVDKDLQVFCSELNQIPSKEHDQRIPADLYVLISSSLLKLEMLNPDIRDVYSTLSSSIRSNCSTTDAVVESFDVLLEYLKDLIRSKFRYVVRVEEDIEALEEKLRHLRNFLGITKRWCADQEELKDFLIQTEAVADNMACLLYLCSEDCEMDDNFVNEMKVELSCQLQKMNPVHLDVREKYIKALEALKSTGQNAILVDEHVIPGFLDSLLANMVELSDLKATSLLAADQLDCLNEELKILRYFLMDPSAEKYTKNHPKVNNIFLQMKRVVCEAACVIYSCYDHSIAEDIARKLNLSLTDLLQQFEVIKQEARDTYNELVPKSLRFNFPKTNELGFIDSVIQKLKELLGSKDDSIDQLRHHVEEVYRNIFSLRGDITEAEEHFIEQELKHPLERFKDAAYHTEYVIDLLVLRDEPPWYYKLGLFDIIEEINNIRSEVDGIKEKGMANVVALEFSVNLGGPSSSEANSENVDAITGFNYEVAGEANKQIDYVELFEDEAKRITEELTNDLTQLSIMSIVGMPGIGKTTLANSIYHSPLVPLHFHAHARCCVTQVYQKRRLLLEILQQVSTENKPKHGLTTDELAEKLYKSLKGKRYLILVDDLWDIRPWNDMRTSFPDDNLGSRIMFTSRFHDIVSKVEHRSIIYPLSPLSEVMSWKLLEVKLFQKENCPLELLGVGMQMAINCKGLPLAVDLVVGLLRNTERRIHSWQQIANHLNTHLLADQQGRCWGVLELSYNHLPNHLKPCFLYFRAFPEDDEVPVSELMQLWIAEGFVQLQNDDKGSIEDVAKKYVSDLIDRSLVIEAKRRSLGGVKAARIHDLLRDFALAKAKEECFMQEMNRNEYLTSPSCVHTMSKPYRLFIHSRWADGAALTKLSSVHVRSLVFSLAASCLESNALAKFKLLRVLKLPDVRNDHWTSIFCLVHLRFLSLKTYSNSITPIPPEISNLMKLETFRVRLQEYGEIELPETIWNLERLRNIKIRGSSILPKYSLEKFKFDNLQTLATPAFCRGEDTEKILRGLPNLRKLSCILLDSWDDSSKCNQFPNFDFLTRLESLKLEYSGEVQPRCEFNFPSNLKKLTLSRFFLPWCEISTIGKLPNLEVLKLLCGAFEGKLWDMTDGEFLELKFLKLENLNVDQWNASEGDHLPCLETLVVVNCNRLEEIPSCLGEVLTLQKIELQHCRSSVEISARKIKEIQEEMGNEQFVLTLN